ncbi:hypothetical protein GQ457_03G030080 [Hibiscus cannabinus]
MAVESQQPKRINCCPGFDDQIALDLIRFDNKLAFVRWIHYKAQSVGGYEVYQSVMLSDIVRNVPLHNAVKCATALLQGETGLKLDSNARFKIINAFICYDNPTDIRFNGQLPLNIAIEHMREQPPFIGWSTTTRQSLYMMIVFCQCETAILNSVRKHFRCTKENEAKKEIYRYAMDRKLVEVSKLELATHMACLLISGGFAEYKDFDLKRSISCAVVTKFRKDFLELLESKLSIENEGTQLEGGTTKIYTKHDPGAMV